MYQKPDWNTYFLDLCNLVKVRSSCVRRKVGAVLVDSNHRVLSSGYNDSPRGGGNCFAGKCPRGLVDNTVIKPYTAYANCIATHAEINCLGQAHDTIMLWIDFEKFGPSDIEHYFSSCKMYVSEVPCQWCWTYLLQHGILEENIIWPGKIESPDAFPTRLSA